MRRVTRVTRRRERRGVVCRGMGGDGGSGGEVESSPEKAF